MDWLQTTCHHQTYEISPSCSGTSLPRYCFYSAQPLYKKTVLCPYFFNFNGSPIYIFAMWLTSPMAILTINQISPVKVLFKKIGCACYGKVTFVLVERTIGRTK